MGSYFTYDKKDEFTQTETNLTKTIDIFENAKNYYIIQKVSQINFEYSKNAKDSKLDTKKEFEEIINRFLIKVKENLEKKKKKNKIDKTLKKFHGHINFCVNKVEDLILIIIYQKN